MTLHFKKNSFIKIVSLTLSLFMHAHATDTEIPVAPEIKENVLCRAIANQNLTNIQRVAGQSLGDAVQDPYAMYNFLTESISKPQAYDQRNRAFTILASAEYDKKDAWTTQSILDATTWQDLNLLSGSKDNPATHLASVLSEGRTHTELGRAYLCGLLARPTSDVALLEARQNIVKRLVEDKELCDSLDALLKDIAQSEKLFTGLWDAELLMQFINSEYSKLDYVGPMINNSSICLEMKSLLNMTGMTVSTGVLAITPAVLTLYGLSMLYSGDPVLTNLTPSCFAQIGIVFELIPSLKNRWAQGVIALIVASWAALSVKQCLQGVHTSFLFDDFLRRRLIHVGVYIQAVCNVFAMLDKNAHDVGDGLSYFNDVQSFFNGQIKDDLDLKHLDSLLHADTFEKGSEDDASLVFSRGNVLCAYYLLGKLKNKFEGIMAGIGELDAYVTIAKLVRESRDRGAEYCFPTYVKDATSPSIQLSNFWNPFIDRNTVVTNSIDLGFDYNLPNMVVTGPNSAGKSTILKAVALSVILAQSLGIAPASAMTLTPFSYVATYMNVADSIVDAESRFQAEARRVFEYGDRLEAMAAKNEFSLALFDEILAGTSPKEGADLGYKVATVLAGYKNSIGLVATHFEKLVNLEADTQGRFINYNVAVAQNSDGSIQFDENNKIKRQFKLLPGFSHQHIAREVFQEKGGLTRSGFFEKCFVGE